MRSNTAMPDSTARRSAVRSCRKICARAPLTRRPLRITSPATSVCGSETADEKEEEEEDDEEEDEAEDEEDENGDGEADDRADAGKDDEYGEEEEKVEAAAEEDDGDNDTRLAAFVFNGGDTCALSLTGGWDTLLLLSIAAN